MDQHTLIVKNTVRLAFTFLVIAAMILARQVLMPLFLSVMLAYLFFPIARWLEKKGVHRILTNLIIILTVIIGIGALVYGAVALYSSFAQGLPDIKSQFETNYERFKQVLMATFGMSENALDILVSNAASGGEHVTDALTATTRTIVTIGLLPVYTFLILFYRDKFRKFISMIIKPDQEETAQKIIDEAATVVPKYLKGLLFVFLILIGLNSIGFYFIGVELALLLGIIAAVFNLIPYLGTILGYGFVFIFVLGTQSPTIALYVAIQFVVVQFIENNILTPNITGSYVSINPLVIIPSLIAASMIWGIAGMLIVIPYIGLFKIVCEHVEGLKPIAFLLGTKGTKRHSISIKSLQNAFGWIEKE